MMVLRFDPNRPRAVALPGADKAAPAVTATERQAATYRQFCELRRLDQRRVAALIAFLHHGERAPSVQTKKGGA